MSDFSKSPAGFRLLIEHPTPWKYVGPRGNTPAAITDANGKTVVIEEGQVSSVVFDAVWAVYWELLRTPETTNQKDA